MPKLKFKFTLLSRFSILSLVLMVAIGALLGYTVTHYFEMQALTQQQNAVRDIVPPVIGDRITDKVLTQGASGSDYNGIESALANLGGSGLVRVKIWNRDGMIVYSDQKQLIGQKFPISDILSQALDGSTSADISSLNKQENVDEQSLGYSQLMEVYTPLRQGGKPAVAGVFEGYYDIFDLRQQIDATSRFLWGSIGFGFLFLYISLFTIVRSASQRIVRQSGENEMLLADTQRKAARLQVVNELARSINQSALDLDEVFRTALRGIDRIVSHNGASITLLDERSGEVVDTIYSTAPAPGAEPEKLDTRQFLTLPAKTGAYLCGEVTTSGKQELAELIEKGIPSLILVSISLGKRQLGLLTVVSKQKNAFDAEDATILKGVADQLAVAIENSHLIAEAAETRALREANRLKDEFMSMVSHELRTPLASIKGYSRTLLARDADWDDETRDEFLTIISDEADRLTELVENLLEMTRIEGGRLRVMPEPVLLGRFCIEVVNRVSMHHPGIKFETDVSDRLPMVEADPRRIEQVLVNLLQNAAAYSRAEVIRVSAAADAVLDGGKWGVVVSVADNGVGIAPEHLPRLFDKFYRVDASKSEDGEAAGTGLGLAIAKALIEVQGGRIWVTSTVGKGATFSFTLPILVLHDGENGAEMHRARPETSEEPEPGPQKAGAATH
jgi:signal transduction histidine kinase